MDVPGSRDNITVEAGNIGTTITSLAEGILQQQPSLIEYKRTNDIDGWSNNLDQEITFSCFFI